MMQSLLAVVLTVLAKLYLWRFRPRIVGITGNVGKTSTREAVAAVLAARFRVRSPAANMNTDVGMPATIIGDFSAAYARQGGTPLFWAGVLVRGVLGLFTSAKRYPEILVLEYGADRPGDIKRLARRFPPFIAVVTHVGQIPVHGEFFASAKELAAEKAQLVKVVPLSGHGVLNYDDLTVLEMRDVSPAADTTFGAGTGADVQYTDVRVRTDNQKLPVGVAFNLSSGGSTMPVAINGVIGPGVAAACAAAVAVGAVYGIGLAEAVQELAQMHPPPGRMRLLSGIKNSVIVDDTYNASPAAMQLAIETVSALSGRKMLVLGDMLELGAHSIQAHQEIGTRAAVIADVLVCVGTRAAVIADAALNQLPADRVHRFSDSHTAAAGVQSLVRTGDVILVKGSQGIRMERIVREIMAEPERAAPLLVRQSARWLAK
jgi:UDP-N-acetylmuramoyl-tripeptide--D-alanyl-D-alanine ligase